MEEYVMQNREEQLNNYLENINEKVGEHNAELVKEFVESYKALPDNPSTRRIQMVVHRLKTISNLMKNKPLDNLTEEDLKTLNMGFREKQFKSAQDYRKTLKKFLKTKNKKKYFDLIDSDYLKAPRRKANEQEMLVNPDEFWEQSQIEEYIKESKHHSTRQLAWAGLWLSTGCRPSEILNLKKQDIQFKEGIIKIRVESGKTGKRLIVLNNVEAPAIWQYLQPHLETLQDIQNIFDLDWEQQNYIHKEICQRINLPENKSRKLYIGRKMALTRFYSQYPLPKASAMAGHTLGSKSMKHYVALTDSQLEGEPLAKIELKQCPNPSCSENNEPHLTQCKKCGSPLNKKQFAQIIEKNLSENIDLKLELFKKEFTLKMLEMKVVK